MNIRLFPLALAAALATAGLPRAWAQEAAPATVDKLSVDPSKKDRAESDFEKFEDESAKADVKPSRDPLRGYNRAMFYVNDKFYFWVGKPLAIVYRALLPEPLRVAVGRGFNNLGAPLRMINSGLQGNMDGAGKELGRFLVNSTLGVGGLFDPADRWMHIKQTDADFGQTLGHYGVGYGFPVVLPLLGQSNLRDGVGMIPNFLVNPVYHATSALNYTYTISGGQFNTLSLRGPEYEKIKKEALDPYAFIRDAHLQNREKKIEESRRK